MRDAGTTQARGKKCLAIGVIVGLASLFMAACATSEPSVEIVGPAEAKVNSSILLEAQATGATPLFGFIGFKWDTRTGTSGAWKQIRFEALGVDSQGNAIDQVVVDTPETPGTTQYRVTASIWQTHNFDEVVYRADWHTIKYIE